MDIKVKNLSYAYEDQTIFENLSFEVKQGETVCIMGPSGKGKTTLLKILTGQLQPQSGTIEGIDLSKVSMVFQENRLCDAFSAASNVRLVCTKNETREEIEKHLSEVGLLDAINKKISELSGGMKRRVVIVRAILAKRDIIIMDEPFKGLDKDTKQLVMDYVMAYTGERTLLVVTHDREEVDYLGGKLLEL